MACKIEILTVTGTSLPQQTNANTVTVGGTAQDCAQVEITIACTQSASKIVTVAPNGSWAGAFDTSALGCTCTESISITAVCVDNPNCFAERGVQLPCTACPFVDDINIIVDLDPLPDPLCVDSPTRTMVTLTAMGSPGAGVYTWQFDVNDVGTTYVPYVSHQYDLPGTYNIKLTYKPNKSGCPETTANALLFVPYCTDLPPPKRPDGIITDTDVKPKPGKRPDGIVTDTDVRPREPTSSSGGSTLGCDALLVAAITLALAGGLTAAIAWCAKAPIVFAIGLGIAVLGLALFFLWWAICNKVTSCSFMRSMHCTLFVGTIGVGPVGTAIVALALGGTCAEAVGIYWGWIGTMYALLGWAIKNAGCETCP